MKQWIDNEEPSSSRARKLAKYWETILHWSGYNFYLEIKEIAKIQKIAVRTVERRLQWFKKNYPEKYEKIKADRAAIRSASSKLDRQLKEMVEGKFLSYDSLDPDIRDEIVKEKF